MSQHGQILFILFIHCIDHATTQTLANVSFIDRPVAFIDSRHHLFIVRHTLDYSIYIVICGLRTRLNDGLARSFLFVPDGIFVMID
mgnify:FL=1